MSKVIFRYIFSLFFVLHLASCKENSKIDSELSQHDEKVSQLRPQGDGQNTDIVQHSSRGLEQANDSTVEFWKPEPQLGVKKSDWEDRYRSENEYRIMERWNQIGEFGDRLNSALEGNFEDRSWLLESLESEDRVLQSMAIKYAGRIRTPEIIEGLIRTLSDMRPPVRISSDEGVHAPRVAAAYQLGLIFPESPFGGRFKGFKVDENIEKFHVWWEDNKNHLLKELNESEQN